MSTTTYSYHPGSGLTTDRLRLLIPDRINERHDPPAMFSDEELNDLFGIVSSEPTPVLEATALACEIVASDKAKQAINFSINGMSINKTSISSMFLQRAKMLRDRIDQLAAVGYEDIDSMVYNIDQWGQDFTEYK